MSGRNRVAWRMPLSSHQIRAARALLDWSQDDLAERTQLGVRTIKRVEAGEQVTRAADHAIRQACELAGIVFVSGPADLAGTADVLGVALRQSG